MTNEEIKLKIRTLYENGGSLTKLSKKYDIKYNTLKSWKSREGWEQNKKKPKDAPKKNAPALKIKDAPKDAIELKFVEELVEEMLESDLSQRESEFCLYYAMSGNMIQSGLKAGYSKNYSTTGLYRLLDKDKIKNEIKKINEIRYKNIMTNEKDVIMQYIRIAYSDIGDYLVQDSEGELSLRNLDEMDTRIIKEITIEKDLVRNESGFELQKQKIKFKIESKHPALKALGEYYDIFNSENNINLSTEKVADYLKGLTPEEIEELLEKCNL